MPLSRWSKAARRRAVVSAVVVAAAFTIVAAMHLFPIFSMSDIGWYLQLAAGDTHSVQQPFASRQLGPAVVRLLAWLLHWPVQRAFVLQGVISLLVTLTAVYTLMVRTTAPRWMLLAAAAVPFWPQLFNGLVLPDLWYGAVLSITLLLLARQRLIVAACMMFPLMVSRESTSLTLVCFLIAAWRPLRWPGRLLALGAGVAGTLLVQRLTLHNPGNPEHLPQSIYLFAKVPWNILRNFMGIEPWSNLYPFLCQVPVWQHSLHLGPVSAVGVCSVSFQQPLAAISTASTTFGLLPLLLAFLWGRRRRTAGRSVLLRFCLIYGAISFLLAPMIGVWFDRLFGYSWPLFMVALPLLFDEFPRGAFAAKRAVGAVGFLGLHLVACAAGFWETGAPGAVPFVILELLLYIAGFLLLRWWLAAPGNGAHGPVDDTAGDRFGDPPRMVKSV